MNYNFTDCGPRYGVGSRKWDELKGYPISSPEEVIPFSVADMEFEIAPEIREGLKKYLDTYVPGYANPTPAYLEAVCKWQKQRHGWDIRPEWILSTPGIVNAFHNAVKFFTEPGEGVLLLTPTYYPMYNAVKANGRILMDSPLILKTDHYEIDFEDFEEKAKDPRTKLFILCNPQNPASRVFTRRELERLGDICVEHHVFVCSDEIHGDITMPGYEHIPFASIKESFADNCATCTAASKTFNLAGFQTSAMIIKNEQVRQSFYQYQQTEEINPKCNILGYEATRLAYEQGAAWCDQMLEMIHKNYQMVVEYCARELPEIQMITMEGTYLLWMDFRKFGIESRELAGILKEKGNLFFDDGYIFGETGEGFERWNLACPTKYIEFGLQRLKAVMEPYQGGDKGKRTIELPYYRTSLPVHVEEKNLEAVIYARTDEYNPGQSQEEIVRKALQMPIGSPRLKELAEGKKRIVVVTSDHTRAVPSKLTLPILLEEIRSANKDADITILIATGLHRPTTEEEQRRMFGDNIVDHEKIINNEAFKDEDFRFVRTLPSGAELWVNKIALDCDLLITEGFIEPHFFAGFSGGRKSILPGICNAVTVNENHSYKAISSPYAAAGVLKDNPIHEDMVCAARGVNVQFILNVALNGRKEVIAAFAGDLEQAHEKGVDFVRSLAQCPSVTGDIVITSNGGYPLDQNLYQSPKAVATAEACCRDGGVIIMCASCVDGMGGSHFEKLIVRGTIDEIDEYLSKIPPKETIPEQWCAQIYSRILKKHKVILVTTFLDHELIRRANMIPASSPDEALALAYDMAGHDAKVVVIPDGVSVLAVKE